MSMHYDCQVAITIAKNKIFNGKNWHIQLRDYVMKHLLKDEIIFIDYVKSEVNLADPLNKHLSRKLMSKISKGMGLKLT